MANRRESGDASCGKMKHQLSKAFLVFFGAWITFCFACSRAPESAVTSGNDSKNLRIATSYKIQNLDPLKSAHYFLVEYGVAELPLMLDNDFNLKPWVLESYAPIDELNWRLILRSDVKFQNGKPLTASALAAAMNRQLENSPSTKAVISGATVKVTGMRELILTTVDPNPNVPAALADEDVFPVYDVEAIEAAGDDREKLMKSGGYTGAYKIASLDEREMKLAPNANYWRGQPPLSSVTVKFVPDNQARILAVQNDETDVALYPPTEAKRMLMNRTDAFFVTSERSGGGPRIVFNVRRQPFDDAAVRRAFSLGINYESLAKNVMDGVFDTATGFYSTSFAWAIQNQKTDTEAAKRLLDEAGWQPGAGGVRSKNNDLLEAVFLVYPQQPDWTTLATAMQAQLREIGFDIKIRHVDDINQAMKNTTDWSLAINSPGILSSGGAPDPSLREHFATGGERNFGKISDAELDRLIEELSRSFDAAKRTELLKRIQQIVIEEKAYEVRPVFVRSRVIVGKKYRDYKPSPQLRHVTYDTRPVDN